jgi:hypothetical protein
MSKGAQEPQELAVTDPFLDRPHQPVMRDLLDARGDVRLHHPPPVRQHSSMSTCRASCAARLGRKPNEEG